MSAAKEHAHKVQVKRNLAAKYAHLANLAKSKPKRQAYLFRAERYTRQADMLQRKYQVNA